MEITVINQNLITVRDTETGEAINIVVQSGIDLRHNVPAQISADRDTVEAIRVFCGYRHNHEVRLDLQMLRSVEFAN